MLRILAGGAACFLLAHVGFAARGESMVMLARCFILAGDGLGAAETAESAAVAQLAPELLRVSAFGLLAAPSRRKPPASAIAGVLWTAVSPVAAFLDVAVWMGPALAGLSWLPSPTDPAQPDPLGKVSLTAESRSCSDRL